MRTDIIDFHTHPFLHPENNYCFYKDEYATDSDFAHKHLSSLGISIVCGSVLGPVNCWEDIVQLNNRALELQKFWGEFYIPGFHIHPDYVEQSIAQVKRMAQSGAKLVGELVPYMHGWSISHPGLIPILEEVQKNGMVVSFHSTGIPDEVLKPLLDRFPGINFVAAHPGEKNSLLTHLHRMERHENYYLDISGSGIGRMGMLRFGIDSASKERFLFGSDFPLCPAEMYISAVEHDPLLTNAEKQAIFCDNAQRILFGV